MMISHAERWQLFEILMKFHFAFHPAMRSNKERQMLCQSSSHFTFHQKTTPEVGINVDKISLALSNFINFLSKNKLRLAADGVRMLFIFFQCEIYTEGNKNVELNANQCRVIVRYFFFVFLQILKLGEFTMGSSFKSIKMSQAQK